MGRKTGPVYHGENLKSGGRNAVLGLAIIIQPPDQATQKLLFKQNLILEDIYNQLLQSVQQVYIKVYKLQKCREILLGLYT